MTCPKCKNTNVRVIREVPASLRFRDDFAPGEMLSDCECSCGEKFTAKK